MPTILHRLSIDAPPDRVHQPAATREGIEQWWTGHPVAGDDTIGAEGGGFNAFPGGEISRWD